MVRGYLFIIAMIIMITTIGCQQNVENSINKSNMPSTTLSSDEEIGTNVQKEKIRILIKWDFKSYMKAPENDPEYEHPYTDVSLIIDGEKSEKIYIGTYMGTITENDITNDSSEEYPKDTFLACAAWYAGSGDYLCISKKSDNKLSVQWKENDEGWVEGEEPVTASFHEIKEIEIPENSTIEVIHTEKVN